MTWDQDNDLDQVLDGALAKYSHVEPRAGLEERILAGLRAQPRRKVWWAWFALPAAAVLVIGIGLRVTRPPSPQSPVVQMAQDVPRPQAPAPEVGRSQPHKSVVPHVPKPAVIPSRVAAVAAPAGEARQAVFPSPVAASQTFPSPAPLTAQEQMMLGLLRRDPEEARRLASAQQAYAEKIRKYFETGELPPSESAPDSNPQ